MLGKPYLILAALIGLIALMGGTFAKGASWGRTQATERCQAEQLEAQQREIAERAVLQAAIDQRDVEIRQREQEAANAIVQVRTEYLPAKTIIRREVVERAVFRDCHAGDRVRDTLNAALAGRPVSGALESGGATGVSG
jgi:hypothetical protein